MSQFTLLWILLGIGLCVIEAAFPTAFVALVSGVAALIVALVTAWLSFDQQMILWIGLSGLGILLSRQFVPERTPSRKFDHQTALTVTEIPAGEAGRVQYEGGSWMAMCEDPNMTIPPQTHVFVVRQRGTTLFVMPEPLANPLR
jgi:membrane protein implicated in regulation of membrane protease activity